MDKIVNVTGGRGGNAFLVLGREKTALIDCGMAYCAGRLISNIKQVLSTMTLDYILISHSHYDHIGAIPYLKRQWPNSRVLGAAYAKRVLNSPTALNTIRNLSRQAAILYGAGTIEDYDDNILKVDDIIGDGSLLELGGLTIKVLETLGHTKCSLSFLVNNHTLFASESTGYMSKTGKVYPAFILSYTDAIASVYKCQQLNPRYIISPHYGLVSKSDTRTYWQKCLLAIEETTEFILRLSKLGYNAEQILIEYEQAFRDEESRKEQPLYAFRLNTQRMIKTVRYTSLEEKKVI